MSASDVDLDALTYRLVANGTKGVATLTNAATGAFSYAPDGSDAAPATLSFTPSEFVLSCFQRIRGGVASGDRAVADTFRDLFFKV